VQRGEPLKRRAPLKRTGPSKRADKPLARRNALEDRTDGARPRLRARPISEASPAQREKCRDRGCVVCRSPGPCDPAHVISRGQLIDGQDDPLAVVPLCREHHRAYDTGQLNLLPYLEPHWRDELAFAVQRYGLISTLRRVTNDRADA
jgi:hypothetical protein